MDGRGTTNPRGLGSKPFNIRPVRRIHLLLSPSSDHHEHISDLLDKYEIERISRELEHYIEEAAAKTTTTDVIKSNGLIGSDRLRGHLRVMSMPRLPSTSLSGERKSKEIMKGPMPPVRHTGGGGGGLKEITKVSRPESGGGMKKDGIDKQTRDIINGCFWLKLASMMCSSRESQLIGFGSDFLRGSGSYRKL